MKNKVVIITGASSGIGKACAIEFAMQGSNIVLAARNTEKLEEVKQEIIKLGVETICVKTDVSIEEDCKNLINQTYQTFGKIDVLINNAGISMRSLFIDTDISVLKKLMDINFWGTVYCTKYALPYLLETKGSLVGIISIAGHVGLPGRTGYASSKFAVRGFLDTIRIENIKKGLHVLVAAPGFTASNIRNTALTGDGTQQGESPRNENKMMTSERCAELIFKATKKRKRQLIMTFIEGKFTVFLGKFLPKLLDKLAYNHMAKEPNSPFK